jgi:hypothetical protein
MALNPSYIGQHRPGDLRAVQAHDRPHGLRAGMDELGGAEGVVAPTNLTKSLTGASFASCASPCRRGSEAASLSRSPSVDRPAAFFGARSTR